MEESPPKIPVRVPDTLVNPNAEMPASDLEAGSFDLARVRGRGSQTSNPPPSPPESSSREGAGRLGTGAGTRVGSR